MTNVAIKFDLRTKERNLRDGTLPKEEYQKYLKSLPDEAANVQEIPIFEETPTDGSAEPTFSAVSAA